MKRLNISNTPSNASVFQLPDGRAFRIHLSVLTPMERLASAEYVDVETHGWQVSDKGELLVDENQEPIQLASQRTRIPLNSIRDGSATAKAGWVKEPAPPENDEEAAAALKGIKKAQKLPTAGEPGEQIVVKGELFTWNEGIYDGLRRLRLTELPALSDDAGDLDPEVVASLMP